jgi:hypothetical protein
MTPRTCHWLLCVAAWARCAGADPEPAATIVRIVLPAEADLRQPVALPTEPENTIEVDFPWPVVDWAGRGFTPDAERFAGDFEIEATRGVPRIFVTPIAEEAHRVLYVVLGVPDGPTFGLPIEFIPAPSPLAWRKVVFATPRTASAPQPAVTLEEHPPRTHLREPSAESELGLMRTLRLMLGTTEDGARGIAAANPALEYASLPGTPEIFGDYSIVARFAVRDSTTDSLGLCASVTNLTRRQIVFDPESWILRAGERVYPIRTTDFANELEPGATGAAFLVLARGPDGDPTRLLPGNDFRLTVALNGPADAGDRRPPSPVNPPR